MFETILNYLNENLTLVYTIAIVLAACLIISIIIVITRKSLNKKRKNAETQKEETQISKQNEQEKSAETIEAQETTVKEEPVEVTKKGEVKAEEPTTEVEKKAEEKPIEEEQKYTGKWLIKQSGKRFIAELLASNAVIMLRTESYSALSGIKSGIETVKNNIEKNNFAISVDRSGNYFFKVFSSSTRLLCVSEAYSSKAACERAIDSVKRFAKTAVIEIEETQKID